MDDFIIYFWLVGLGGEYRCFHGYGWLKLIVLGVCLMIILGVGYSKSVSTSFSTNIMVSGRILGYYVGPVFGSKISWDNFENISLVDGRFSLVVDPGLGYLVVDSPGFVRYSFPVVIVSDFDSCLIRVVREFRVGDTIVESISVFLYDDFLDNLERLGKYGVFKSVVLLEVFQEPLFSGIYLPFLVNDEFFGCVVYRHIVENNSDLFYLYI